MRRSLRKPQVQSGQPPDRQGVVARVLAVAIGAGLALLYTGFVEHAYRILDCTPLTFQMAAGAALVATSLGPRMLRGVALRLARAAQTQLTPDGAAESTASAAWSADRNLLWMATSVAGLAAGLGALLLPEALGLAAAVLDWGYRRFLWTSVTLTAFESGVLAASSVGPFALIGFFLRCVHQLACPQGRWGFAATGWMIAGMAGGFAGMGALAPFPAEGVLLLRAGAIALLVAAIISVARASPAVRRVRGPRAAVIVEPEIGERWPVVLRLAMAVAACAGVTQALLWIHVLEALGMASGEGHLAAGAVLLAAGAVGLGRAPHETPSVPNAVGAVGERLALTGLAGALGVALFNLVARACYGPFVNTPGSWLLWVVCAGAPVGLAGWSIGFGGAAALRRTAHPAATGARLLRMLLLAAGVAATFVALPLLSALGSYAALVAAALALLATGGILIIHESAREPRVRRWRVAGVFVAVVLLTCLMPVAGSGWLGNTRQHPGRLVESWWLTWDGRAGRALGSTPGSANPGSGTRSDTWATSLFNWGALPRGARVAMVSLAGGGASSAFAAFAGRYTDLAVDGDLRHRLTGEPTSDLAALRTLRAAGERYDLLVLSCAEMPAAMVRRIAATRAMEDALARLAPDGVLAVLIPRDERLAAPLERMADTALRRSQAAAAWTTVRVHRQDDVVLLATHTASGRERWARWCVGELAALEPTEPRAAWAVAVMASRGVGRDAGDVTMITAR